MSSNSKYVDDSSIESESYSSSSTLRSFSAKLASSNCEKVIILPAYSWDDVACGIYEAAGSVTSDSEYGRDVYANAI